MLLGSPIHYFDGTAKKSCKNAGALIFDISEDGSVVAIRLPENIPHVFIPLLQARSLQDLCESLRKLGFSKVFEEFKDYICECEAGSCRSHIVGCDIVLKGRNREVLLVSKEYDHIQDCVRLSVRLASDIISESVSLEDVAAQSVCALALASQLKPILFLNCKTFVSSLRTHACVRFLTLNDGRSATLNTFDGEKPGAPLLRKLTFHGDRLYQSEDLAQSGLFNHATGRMQVQFPDGRTGIISVHHLKTLNAQTKLFSGYIILNEYERITSFINSKWPQITDKEIEVVALIVSGLTTKEAASQLDKSATTASIQARSALQKTGFRSMNSFLTFIRTMTV